MVGTAHGGLACTNFGWFWEAAVAGLSTTNKIIIKYSKFITFKDPILQISFLVNTSNFIKRYILTIDFFLQVTVYVFMGKLITDKTIGHLFSQ